MLEGMDPEADEIRKRLAKLPMRGNKRQYTAAVKQAVLDFVKRSVASGRTEAASCKAIGMHQATVSEWRLGPRRRASVKKTKDRTQKRVLPVELEATPSMPARSLTLTLPGGAQVEGLELAHVVELAKALR